MLQVNTLKSLALTVLLDTTFAYVKTKMYDAYANLAKENAKIQGTPHASRVLFFMYKGKVYPNKTPAGANITHTHVHSVALHSSLIDKKKEIDGFLDAVHYNAIRNFYVAVLGASYNEIVLEALLPVVLISALQAKFTKEEYKAIDTGTTPITPPLGDKDTGPTKEETLHTIESIKKAYALPIVNMKKVLTEQFFLQ